MRNETLLFDSFSIPVPEIRRDLELIPITDSGRKLFYFHDAMGYASPDFALDSRTGPVLALLNGMHNIKEIASLLGENLSKDEILDFVQLLDQNRILNTRHFRLFSNRIEKDFENAASRPPVLSGESYPADPAQLTACMDDLFSDSSNDLPDNPVYALYAPHIDVKVGGKQYAEAFSHLRRLQPERVVILATSHYSGYYPDLYEKNPFIGSLKSFEIPGRSFQTDSDYINRLSESGENSGFTLHDRAHRIEHSIEIHLLFSGHIWNHPFRIVPVLVGGFEELMYHATGDLAEKTDLFADILRQLHDKKTFYLISGDLSHVGKKFGDPLAASEMREDVEQSDHRFIEIAKHGDPDKLTGHLATDYDATRICGYPPLYTFLKTFPGSEGELINYFWWDEKERESAVSFASLIYGPSPLFQSYKEQKA